VLLVLSTIAGNTILCLLLVGRGWAGRLQCFTILTGLAVAVDASFYFIHGFAHWMYGPLRIATCYWLFPILEAFAAWEAWRVSVKWLEYLLLVQVGLAIVGGAAHLHGDPWGVYYLEMFAIWFNLLGIIYSIYRFSKEVDYARP
jgi:hypothetical protein